jgi:hypothetical protein
LKGEGCLTNEGIANDLVQQGYVTSEPFAIENEGHFTPKVFLLARGAVQLILTRDLSPNWRCGARPMGRARAARKVFHIEDDLLTPK